MSRSKDAVDMQKRITKAIAAANPTVPYSVTAARVASGQLISVALDFRWTKLPKAPHPTHTGCLGVVRLSCWPRLLQLPVGVMTGM
jgi:hypothetical protein